MKRTLIYTVIVVVVGLSTTAAVVSHRKNEKNEEGCAVRVRQHLAVLAVSGPEAGHVCAKLIAKHPEFWEVYVPPRVTRNYDTPENTVDVVCTGAWPPRRYTIYDVNIGHVFPGRYGTDLCASLEDHEPASRF